MDTFLPFLGSRSLRTKAGFQALGLGLGVLLLCIPAFGQLNLGSITGTVTDASGAVISGANVTVTDVERGVSRTLTTDSAGQYSATSLTPGSYSVRAEFTGFQTLNRTGISVGVGQAVRVDLAMQPGAQTQTVTVTEAVPLINTSNEVLSSTVENDQLSRVANQRPPVHESAGLPAGSPWEPGRKFAELPDQRRRRPGQLLYARRRGEHQHIRQLRTSDRRGHQHRRTDDPAPGCR